MSTSDQIVNTLPRQNALRRSGNGQHVSTTACGETSRPIVGVRSQARMNHWKVKHLPLSTDRGSKQEDNIQSYRGGCESNCNTSHRQEHESSGGALYICPQCATPIVPVRGSNSSAGSNPWGNMPLGNEGSLLQKSSHQVMTDSGISIDKEAAFDLDVRKKKHLSWKTSSVLTESFNDFRLSPDPPPSPAKRPKEVQLSFDSIYKSLQNEELTLAVDEHLQLESGRSILSEPIISGDEKRIGKIRLRIQDSICELENMKKISSAKSGDICLEEPTQIDDIQFQLSILCEAKEVLNRQMQELWKMYLHLVFQERSPDLVIPP